MVKVKVKENRLEDIISVLKTQKAFIGENYKIKEIGVFGSYVRGEQQEKSDLDILVDFEETIGLFKFAALERYLTELLGIKVDLVMKSALKPRIGSRILREVAYL